MKHKAISLMSGGLDSVLSTILIAQQNIDVIAVKFLTPFGCSIDDSSCGFDASHLANRFGFTFKVCPMGEEYVKMVRKPVYGWGDNMNPCIDCRIIMLKWAKDIMVSAGASFIITGEVLNQRPMSQRGEKLHDIEKETGLEGLLLRPLSAKLLPETIPEQQGVVNRSKLYAIQGRSRAIQLQLANELKLTKEDHGQPAGGCLLTDPSFSNKLKDFWDHSDSTIPRDMEILKLGRHFRYSNTVKFIVGRNENENSLLKQLANENEIIFEFDTPAPTILVQGSTEKNILQTAIQLGIHYTKKKPSKAFMFYNNTNTEIDIEDSNLVLSLDHIT